MRALGLSLLTAALVLVAACDGCAGRPDDAAAPAPAPAPQVRTVDGEGWSIEVPSDWKTHEPGLYVGPDRANVLVRVKEVPLPVALLVDNIKEDLRRRHPDIAFEEQRGLKLGELSVLELRGRYTSRGGKRVVQHQLVGEGGKRKYVVTMSVVEPHYPKHRETFEKITLSFRGEFEALSPAAPVSP